MNFVSTYINESLEELRQVRWPTQQQAVRLSVIVIGFIIATSLAFGLVDLVLSEVISKTITI